MFRTKLTLVGLALTVALLGLSSSRALAAHDSWYGYAVSLSKTQQTEPFITDTLAPGGSPSQSRQSVRFVTDTLAPGGATPVQRYRFTTDTLAPGGGPGVASLPASNGFNWGAGGIGAAVMVGIALLLLASRRTLQRRKVVAV